jgi:hypothetical protein
MMPTVGGACCDSLPAANAYFQVRKKNLAAQTRPLETLAPDERDEISYAFLSGNPVERGGDFSPKLLNSARLWCRMLAL